METTLARNPLDQIRLGRRFADESQDVIDGGDWADLQKDQLKVVHRDAQALAVGFQDRVEIVN